MFSAGQRNISNDLRLLDNLFTEGNEIRNINLKTALISLPLIVSAILFSKYFLDDWIALRAMEILRSSDLLSIGTSDIPDLLATVVVIVCALFWGRYIVLKRHGTVGEQMLCCKVVGTAVPMAFFLKWPFKFTFGRLNTRIWLISHASDKFHWFQRGEHYDSFPSGHMMVFAAFFAALWFFYPCWRSIFAGLTLILALTLVATDYHFFSDVIAGAYLGLFVTLLTLFFFNSSKQSQAER